MADGDVIEPEEGNRKLLLTNNFRKVYPFFPELR